MLETDCLVPNNEVMSQDLVFNAYSGGLRRGEYDLPEHIIGG